MNDMKLLCAFVMSAVAMFAGLLDATGVCPVDAAAMLAGAVGCGTYGRRLWESVGPLAPMRGGDQIEMTWH
jgi:hypothetical protein